jgi:hypothetical protein
MQMDSEIFFIRSVTVQNLIMGLALLIIAGLLLRFVTQHKFRHATAVGIWALIILWFFNSPLWGFSAVTISPQGLKLDYGFLSIAKNTTLPPDTAWKIHVYLGGIRKLQKLYYFQLTGHKSLKVQGPAGLASLQSLGAAIDRLNDRSMGRLEEQPVNR